jgi:hypothetical protein
MFNALRTAALSAVIGASALMAIPAQAEDLYLNFGGRDGVGVQLGDGDSANYRRHDERRYSERRNNRGCSEGRALDKAERMGLRRARVTDVDRRTIEVSGRKRGDRVTVIFARAPNCPIVGY